MWCGVVRCGYGEVWGGVVSRPVPANLTHIPSNPRNAKNLNASA